MQDKIIFTLGTDRRGREDFVEILLGYEIQALLDVRSFPHSRLPLFQRDNLEPLLAANGIEYHFLGRELGGLRKGGYVAYLITDYFREGIDAVEEIAGRKRSVIICAEKLPWKCHRKWIARELCKKGWTVEHIIEKGKIWVPK
ncbi:MAG: DUF488 domain-containing protein [Nitrospiraceae bacterium]|nr:DUF488 domain-containing protein [Nitrospiraceae bacterium]